MNTQSKGYPESAVAPGDRAATTGCSATAAIAPAAQHLEEKVREMVETGKHRATDWKCGLQESIREKPFQSVLIAAAIGAFIGLVRGRA